MKRIIIGLLIFAGALTWGKLDAQTLKLDIQGITFQEDTVTSTENIVTHTAISVKKNEKSSTIVLSGSKLSSIRDFEFGWNMVETDPQGEWFSLRNWRSNQVTLNFFILSAVSKTAKRGISMGFGLRFNNYMFDSPFTVAKQDGIAVYAPITEKIKKSKFTTAALHIPLEFTFGRPNRLALSVGGYADLTYSSHTKIKYCGGSKDKVWNYPVNFLQLGYTGRLTIKGTSIFCNYSPKGLFKSGKGPHIETWTIGIGL